MTSRRSRFLATLNERLESDLAARERNGDDDATPPAGLEFPEPGAAHEVLPEDVITGDEIADAPSHPAAQIDPEQDADPDVASSPHGRSSPLGTLVSSEGESTLRPSVPWSETGLPLRLREAIASARRVSHEMQEGPLDDEDPGRGPVPYGHDADDRDHDDLEYQGPPPDEPEAPLERDAMPEDEHTDSGRDSTYEEAPPPDGLVPLENEVVHEDGELGGSYDAAFEEPSPDDDLTSLDEEDATYQHEQELEGETADREHLPGHAAADEQTWLDQDGERQESAPAHWDAFQDRQPLRRSATTRYGVHAAAFAVAIAFVALAGFGLGIMSGAGDTPKPLARDTATAAPTQPVPASPGEEAQPADPETAELGELQTVRVAPAPVAAEPEPAPTARDSTRAPPLPPPPKPVLLQAATDEPAPTHSDVDGTVDDAFAALIEGAGGPFEPLFAKLPSSRPIRTRVLVHYTAGAVGAPATAMHLVRHLKAAGFAVEARPVEVSIPRNSIRYFFDADRGPAEALRSSLEGQIPDGAELSVMDFRSQRPKPKRGVIEVWLRA